jgi:hypothetical protein
MARRAEHLVNAQPEMRMPMLAHQRTPHDQPPAFHKEMLTLVLTFATDS